MLISVLYSKIHRATVTACEIDYNGSLGVDEDIMDKAGLIEGQKIDVLNVNNGQRFSTYVIRAERGSKTFGVFGAAARLAQIGDKIIIIAYAQMSMEEAKKYKPVTLLME